MAEVVTKDDSVGEVEFMVNVDSIHVRAHQHAARTREKGGACSPGIEALSIHGEGLGGPAAGLTSKLHAAAAGLPAGRLPHRLDCANAPVSDLTTGGDGINGWIRSPSRSSTSRRCLVGTTIGDDQILMIT